MVARVSAEGNRGGSVVYHRERNGVGDSAFPRMAGPARDGAWMDDLVSRRAKICFMCLVVSVGALLGITGWVDVSHLVAIVARVG